MGIKTAHPNQVSRPELRFSFPEASVPEDEPQAALLTFLTAEFDSLQQAIPISQIGYSPSMCAGIQTEVVCRTVKGWHPAVEIRQAMLSGNGMLRFPGFHAEDIPANWLTRRTDETPVSRNVRQEKHERNFVNKNSYILCRKLDFAS